MHVEQFLRKNGLTKYKFLIKGYCTYTTNDYKVYLFLLQDYIKNKYAFYFIENDYDIDFRDLIKLKNFTIPDIVINDKQVVFDKFYKPIGQLAANFTYNVLVEESALVLSCSSFEFKSELNQYKTRFNILDADRYIEVSSRDFCKNLNKDVWIPDNVITHNGKMHADDIFAVALAKYFNPNIKITRTREVSNTFNSLVVDVGRGRYDHHDTEKYRDMNDRYDVYGNEKQYAAFGLLAKDLLLDYLGVQSYHILDTRFIALLDNSDNYGTDDTASYLFDNFNPAWNDDKTPDECFSEAVDIALIFIRKIIEKEKARSEAIPYVKEKLKSIKNNILVLDKRAPWQSLAKKSAALIAIYPTDDGWAVQVVKKDKGEIVLPELWLYEPPAGMTFCHKTLYFANFKTFEDAYDAAMFAINT